MAQAGLLCLPVIVIGEYRYGIQFSRTARTLATALERLLVDLTVLPVEDATTPFYAEIRGQLKSAGTPIPENDIWIAALAQQHELPVVSRDQHFDRVTRLRRVTW